MTDVLAAALGYINFGYSIIPIRPGSKKPSEAWKNTGATNSRSEATERWSGSFSTHGIGIVTGPDSGCFVLDIDGTQGAETLAQLEHEHGTLPETVEQATGNGRHLFFAYPAEVKVGNSASKIGPGVDVRGKGGYVCAPPTVHPDTGALYEWLDGHAPGDLPFATAPAWLVDLCAKKQITSTEANVSPGPSTIPPPAGRDQPIRTSSPRRRNRNSRQRIGRRTQRSTQHRRVQPRHVNRQPRTRPLHRRTIINDRSARRRTHRNRNPRHHPKRHRSRHRTPPSSTTTTHQPTNNAPPKRPAITPSSRLGRNRNQRPATPHHPHTQRRRMPLLPGSNQRRPRTTRIRQILGSQSCMR